MYKSLLDVLDSLVGLNYSSRPCVAAILLGHRKHIYVSHHALLSCTTSCRPLTCSGYIGCVMSKKVRVVFPRGATRSGGDA